MSIRVNFCIQLRDGSGNVVQEDEIQNNFEFYAPVLHDMHVNHSLEGCVTIQSPSQDEINIWDDLWVIVQNLFFYSIVDLLNQDKSCFLYSYLSQYAHLVLVPSSYDIYIFGDDRDNVPPTSFNKTELLLAFYHCGQRYLDLLRRLKNVSESGPTFVPPHLEIEAEKAQKALEAHNLL